MKGVVLLHDDAHPHRAETIWKPKYDVMVYSPYSPDFDPFDYNLLGP